MQRTKGRCHQEELFANPQMEFFGAREAHKHGEFAPLQPRARKLVCTLCLAQRPLVWSVSTNIRHSFQVCEFCLQKIELTEREGPLDS